MVGARIVHMSETVVDLGQRYVAALWGAAASIGADEIAMHRLSGLVESISEAEAQLAGCGCICCTKPSSPPRTR